MTALQCIFAVSGVCGLIYESIWSHYLKLFVGHAAYAQTVVLIVFIGGMALGAALVGRIGDRIRSPLVAYAIAEGLVGVVSLFFHGGFVASTEWAYASLLPAACVPETPCIAQWVFAAILILPQSILLGTTFPLMTSGVLRLSPSEPGRQISLLYFLNSIGAAAGVLLSGFLLIPAMGLPGTLLTAGLMNIVVALVAWAVGRKTPAQPASRAAEVGNQPDAPRRWLIVVAALTGLSSFVYEIIWIRMLALVVGASTHAFELMLAAFIAGLAFGGLWVRKRIDRFNDLIYTLALVQVLMGIAAVATLALYDGMFDVMRWLLGVIQRGESAYVVYNLANHVFALAIMLPATYLAGMTFPLITTALFRGRDGERAIGYTYAANTFGSIIGVALAVHFALPVLGIKGGLLFGAAIDIALGVALLFVGVRARAFQSALSWGVASTAVLLIVAVAVPVLPERMASGVYRSGRAKLEADRELVYHVDGKTASVTFSRSPTVMTIATNGKPDASIARSTTDATSDEVTMAMTALLPLAYRPEARTAAVIGFGSGMTTATLLGSPNLERVDTIEIEPRMVDAARHFGDIVKAAYTDPRSRIVIDDAKSYFARSHLRYDLIVSEPSNPWVSGVASLFTQEFYARAKRQLTDRGLFVQWIQVYEFNDALFAAILRAVDAEFEDYEIYAANDGDLIIVASAQPLASGPRSEFTKWSTIAPMLQRVRVQTVDELHLRRVAGRQTIRPLLMTFGDGVNSDYYPIVEQRAPLARFAGDVANGLLRAATAPVPVMELLGEPAKRDLIISDDAVYPPLGRSMSNSARHVATFLRSGATSGRPPSMMIRDVGYLRSILWDCVDVPSGVAVRELMLPVATVVNPMSSRREATRTWEAVRTAPCATRLEPRDREWLDLFAAVGARDVERMAELGTRLAKDSEPGSAFATYAVMAGVAGLVAGDRHAEAEQFLIAASHALSDEARNDPAMRLLVVATRFGLARQAALSKQ